MVQHLHSGVRSLERARRELSAIGVDTGHLDEIIPRLKAYTEGIAVGHDPYLSTVVLFLTQQHGQYIGSINNPALKNRLGIESTEEVQGILDGYVVDGTLVSYSINRRGKISHMYKLSDGGYELSLEVLRRKAENDNRDLKDINITEIGLSPSALNPLVRNNIKNLYDLFSRGTPYIANPKAGKEVTDKTAFYKERMA